MPRIELNGNKLHYQQMGQGPDIVLVHGLFSNIAFWWGHIAPILAQTHRVTALDLRGHGLSGMTERGYRAVDLADDVCALLDYLDIDAAHIVGHSYGGAVCLAVALNAPERVSRLTLADAWVPCLQHQTHMPNVRGWSELKSKLAARGIEQTGDLPMVAMAFLEELADAPDAAVQRLGSGTGRAAWMPTDVKSQGVRRWRRLMASTHAWKEFYKTDRLGPEHLAKVTLPVDLVYGVQSGYRMTRDGLVKVLPDVAAHDAVGGHYFPVMQPHALTEVVMRPRLRGASRDRLAG